MSAPAVPAVRHLIDQYRRFLRSTYRLADPRLRQQFEAHIDSADVLVKGPYVTLARDFAAGKAIAELAAEGVGHPGLSRMKWSFGSGAVYRHQEKAFRLAEAGRNCVIKTGTGSGKTEAFLLPVLSGILKARDQGVKGTKAIILYPMNALANDQLLRLRELIRNSGLGLTFGMYTGESDTVAEALGPPVPGNEILKRAEIRTALPDLIITNYKELEFMLIRNVDRPIFSEALQFLVLDEIHSYRGRSLQKSRALSVDSRRVVGSRKAACVVWAPPRPFLREPAAMRL